MAEVVIHRLGASLRQLRGDQRGQRVVLLGSENGFEFGDRHLGHQDCSAKWRWRRSRSNRPWGDREEQATSCWTIEKARCWFHGRGLKSCDVEHMHVICPTCQ